MMPTQWAVYVFECAEPGCHRGVAMADHQRRDPDTMGAVCTQHPWRPHMKFVEKIPLVRREELEKAVVQIHTQRLLLGETQRDITRALEWLDECDVEEAELLLRNININLYEGGFA